MKLMLRLHSFAFLFSFVFCLPAVAQVSPDPLQTQFDNYAQNYPREKLFVHTDKSFYVPGEILWFKIYAVDAASHALLNLSKVAYIEVMDQQNKAVLQAKVELKNGTGNGSFLLPVSVPSGNFLLRAYTRWMKNFDPGYYFEKPVTIVNTLRTLSASSSPSPVSYDIRFFPEGGNLVRNIESRVAFKVSDHYGKGIDCSGSLLNQNNDTLVLFKTQLNGIGSFYFTPKQGETYKAVVNTRADSAVTANFPAIYEQGYVMRVENTGEQLKITVSSTDANDHPLYLLSHTRQKTNFVETKTIKNNQAVFLVDKKDIGDGITSFTLFNYDRQPVCERIYFKKPATYNLAIHTDNPVYAPRSKVQLAVAAEGTKREELSNISVSVYLADSLQTAEKMDILNYLWLSSDLAGNIEDPGYYFTNTGPEAAANTDNLMLTHGWRRFKWEDVLSNKKPYFEFIPEYEGHIINGKVVNKQTGLPASTTIPAYLSAPGKRYQFANTLSDNRGQVLFNMKDFIGSEEIIVQTNSKTDSNYRVDILNPFSEKYSLTRLPALTLPAVAEKQLLHHSINSQVQSVYSTDSLNRFYFPFSDTNHFFSPAGKTYYLDLYTRFTTMEEVLREYILEAAVRLQNKKFHVYMLRNPHEFFSNDPLMLIDGVPFFDTDSLMAVDPLKIQKIELLSRGYFYGPVPADGILSYSTYKGNLEGIRLDPNAVVIEYEGLQLKREFYSPAYESPEQKNSRIPDFRNLLFWSPDVKMSAADKDPISFYTSDLEGKYFILLQGITKDGRPFSTSAGFEVKK